jgi:ceramide glucosyltransferase
VIHVPAPVSLVLLALTIASVLYAFAALVRLLTLRLPAPAEGNDLPAITVLKPLCGLEPELESNLASFCAQDYARYQVIFAAQDPTDPALDVARRIRDSHPACEIEIVSGGGTPMLNPKIENLSAAVPRASGEIVVIADSDVCVDGSYLRGVAAPFADDRVGAVTAIYGARASGGLPSRLGAMFVNEQFIPSVLVATSFQMVRFTLGATMAVRRGVLEAIGGTKALGETIADDYALGQRVSSRGDRVAFAGTIPLTLVSEQNVRDLLAREVRWARTIRSVRPVGYAGTIVTFPFALALLNCIFFPNPWVGIALLIGSIALRIGIDLAAHRVLRVPGKAQPWLVPLREALSVAVWAAGLFGRKARWRHRSLLVGKHG